MASSLAGRSLRLLSLVAIIGALLFVGTSTSPSKAEAGWSPYCGNQPVGAWGGCWGAKRLITQTYGYGLQKGVCVWGSLTEGGPALGSLSGCTTLANTGVYSPAYWEPLHLYPAIANNSAAANTLVGVAITP
ncbi:MAG: hypothetical protein QOE75_864 [Solirubrobacterales bacterium]|jgi:hypothetical protein|nr:hypothetical protein [Solirubrobacterales bacterium]